MSVFGDNLKRIRIERGLTNSELAKLANTYEVRLWSYEYGSGMPSNRVIAKIAKALDVEPSDLTGVEKQKPKRVISNQKRKKREPNPDTVKQELAKIDRSTFGGNLKYLRMERNLSMRDLGNLIGVATTTVSTYENADKTPSPDRMVKLAEALGVPMKDLVPDGDTSKDILDDFELRDYLSELRERPELRPLFSLSKDATKEDVDQTIAILGTLMNKHDDNN